MVFPEFVTVSQLVDFNHVVVEAQSPRVAVLSYLGNSSDDSRNPNGVAPVLHVKAAGSVYVGSLATTPFGVAELIRRPSRVAEYSNPWARG